MRERIRVLLIDDDEDEHVLVREMLEAAEYAKFELECAAHFEEGQARLKQKSFDVCLVDYRLGAHDGLTFIAEAVGMGNTVPLVMLTGQGDRAVDQKAIAAGAQDFLRKDRLNEHLLEQAVLHAIERNALFQQLKEALASVRRLSGLLPLCASCKSVRDDKGYWQDVALYMRDRLDAEITHGICPPCAERLYGDFAAEDRDS